MGAIGVFDSGVGGLSVLREIRRELPHEALLYVADSGYAPYGDKSEAFIVGRSQTIADFLISRGATSLVVACNTATAAAVDSLRARHTLPIVGVEPGVKPAVAYTSSGVIGVLTTSRTALSSRFQTLVMRHGATARIVVQPCPGWVEMVEQGELEGGVTAQRIRQYVEPLLAGGADVLVLGCTHYSFLTQAIRGVVGDDVALVDPAAAVARHLRNRLEHAGLVAGADGVAPVQMWTSGDPDRMRQLVAQLWGQMPEVASLPAPFSHAPDEHQPDL